MRNRPRTCRPALELLEDRTLPATFVVTNAGDSAAAGSGSLRAAILASNTNPAPSGTNLVQFAIPGSGPQVIAPASPLPTVMAPLFIDGASQPGFVNAPLIVLDGAAAGAGANGLTLAAPSCTVRGLVIDDFKGDGVFIQNNQEAVTNDYVGIDPTGTAARGNGIGIGTDRATRTAGLLIAGDVISGNTGAFAGYGVVNFGTGATLSGNLIGTDVSGTRPVGNQTGVLLGQGSAGCAVGGNVISGNALIGLYLVAGSGNVVANNLVGVDATGERPLPNGYAAAPGSGAGVALGNSATRNTFRSNVISDNVGDGVFLSAPTIGNLLVANLIGTDLSGTVALGNSHDGVEMNNPLPTEFGASSGNVVAGNTISGNGAAGVELNGGGPAALTGNLVVGNRVGTDAGGGHALPNLGPAAVLLTGGAAGNTIDSDLISGNASDGVLIQGSGASGNMVQRCLVGLAPSGTALPNGLHGVVVASGAAGNTLYGNDIWFNRGHGVIIRDSGTGGTTVQLNVITANAGAGVLVLAGTTATMIGGTQAGQGNAIDLNGQAGVWADSTAGVAVEGNSIFGNTGLGGIALTNGANGSPAALTLAYAVNTGMGNTAVVGTLHGAPGVFRVELFDNPAGGGQGQVFLGVVTVTTDSFGNAVFSADLAGAPVLLTATLTDGNGDTSTFSLALPVAHF
jgi:parallel beta-helix repeat protein